MTCLMECNNTPVLRMIAVDIMPDQRFPAQFPQPHLVDDERFLLIVKNRFPKKLSLKVLQHRTRVPYRSLQEEESAPVADVPEQGETKARPHPHLAPLQSKFISSNSEPILNTLANTKQELEQFQAKMLGGRGSLIRENTYYPHGWPQTRTSVKQLKQSKVSHSDRLNKSLNEIQLADEGKASAEVLSRSWSAGTSNLNSRHIENNLVTQASLSLKTTQLQPIPVPADITHMQDVNLGKDYSNNYMRKLRMGPAALDSLARNNPLSYAHNGDNPPSYVHENSSVLLDDVQSARNTSMLPPITKLSTSGHVDAMLSSRDDEMLSKNQQTELKKQTKLPALNTRSSQDYSVHNTDNGLLSSNDKLANQAHTSRVQKRKRGKRKHGNGTGESAKVSNTSVDITTRKPVVSNLCVLQDLVQMEPAPKQTPVDPYSVFLKYHGRKQVIDSSTYHTHARKTANRHGGFGLS